MDFFRIIGVGIEESHSLSLDEMRKCYENGIDRLVGFFLFFIANICLIIDNKSTFTAGFQHKPEINKVIGKLNIFAEVCYHIVESVLATKVNGACFFFIGRNAVVIHEIISFFTRKFAAVN